ncbi:hypothetical protein MPER_00751 [Moniliophthora perniciosa FA553]|nr:hypothetical protein MPER_00751 [Moniliophthora perniciosa FA553]
MTPEHSPPVTPIGTRNFDADLENSSADTVSIAVSDPYSLKSKLRDPNDIAELRKRGNSTMQKKVGKFYEAQNEKIEAMLKSLENHAKQGSDDAKDNALKVPGPDRDSSVIHL